MTRPFRAWNKRNNCWFSGGEIAVLSNGRVIKFDEEGEYVELGSELYEICFSTGLLDKNGKEIYEGDICKMEWNGHEIIAPIGLDATVKFKSPEHIADVPTPPEVIGNIYEGVKARDLVSEEEIDNFPDELDEVEEASHKPHPCSDPELKEHCSGCTDPHSEGTHQGCTIEHGHVGCHLAKESGWPTQK